MKKHTFLSRTLNQILILFVLLVSGSLNAQITSYPYTEDFESGPSGWTVEGGITTWTLGSPLAPIINSAASGTNAWVTNLSGDYVPNENGSVVSPQFDFSFLYTPSVEFKLWWNSEFEWDGVVLQYSSDLVNWQNVGTVGTGINWFNTFLVDGGYGGGSPGGQNEGWSGRELGTNNGSGDWVTVSHPLSNLAGMGSVYFRLAFGSDQIVHDEGVGFDDFTIKDNCQLTLSQSAQNLELIYDGNGNVDEVNTWLNNNGNAIVSTPCGNVDWDYDIIDDFLEDTNGDSLDDRLNIEIEFIGIDEEGNSIFTNAFIVFDNFATAGEGAGNGGAICEDTFPISDFDDDLFTFPNQGVDYTDAKYNSSIFDIEQTSGKPGLERQGTDVKFPDTGAGQFTFNFQFKVQTTVIIGMELPRMYETTTNYTANNVTVAFEPGPNIEIEICDFDNVSLLDLYNELEIQLDVDTSEFNEAADFGNIFEPQNSWYNENDNLEDGSNPSPLTEITEPGVYQFNAKNFLQDCAGEPVFVTLIGDLIINQQAQNLVIQYDSNGNNTEIDAWLDNKGGATTLGCGDVTWEWELTDFQLSTDVNPDDTFLVCTIEFKAFDINEIEIGNSTALLKYESFPTAGLSLGNGGTLCGITSYDLNQLASPNYNSTKFNSSIITVSQNGGFPGVTSSGPVVTFPDTGAGQFSYSLIVSIDTPVGIGSTLTLDVESTANLTVGEVIIPFEPGPNITVELCDFDNASLLDLYNELEIQLDVDTSEFNEAADFGNIFEPQNSWYNENDNLEDGSNPSPLTEITEPGVYQFNAKNFLEDCAGEPVFVTLDFEPSPVAGDSDFVFEDCFDFNTVDLSNYLSFDADANGTWESLDGLTIINNKDVEFPDTGAGQFTYNFIYRVQNSCGEEDEALIDIEINNVEDVNAGNSQVDISISPSVVDLDTYLSNNATLGGLWSGDLLVNVDDGTVVFPDTGAGQFFYSFSYLVENECGQSETATFDFVIDIPDNAGENGDLNICSGNLLTEGLMFNALNGSPQTGGTWSPALNGGGVYTYTVNAVNSDSATVTVTEEIQLSAGENGGYTINSGETVTESQLFNALEGTPDPGGVWSPTPDGVQMYTYTHAAGACEERSAVVDVVLSVININKLDALHIYPNPTSDFIYLKGNTTLVERIDLFSIAGQKIKSIKSNFEEIDVKMIEAGVYFLKISNKKQQKIIKFIKE
ncbi:T9SS type A sorting domain-containing protein [uncultured Winogradskyella sp.]|uniref:T9SS type A sorting domain-containing protein n=1 Tax=uncultured Winogradskyella sp. TaxID=395353 RepID=UPI0030DBF9D7